jgi:hypothetical protein
MLFRSSWKWAAIIFVVALMTFGFSNWVFMFIINKFYIKDLIAEGYKAKSVKTGTIERVSSSLGFRIPELETTTAVASGASVAPREHSALKFPPLTSQ